MKVETRFANQYTSWTREHELVVRLEGRPEWVEKALEAIRAAMDKIDGAREQPR